MKRYMRKPVVGIILAMLSGQAASFTRFPICTAPGDQIGPRINGNYVVWTDKRNKQNQDIYGARLEY